MAERRVRVEHYNALENQAIAVIDLYHTTQGYLKLMTILVLSPSPRVEKGIQSRYQ